MKYEFDVAPKTFDPFVVKITIESKREMDALTSMFGNDCVFDSELYANLVRRGGIFTFNKKN